MTHDERAQKAVEFCREIALCTDVPGETTRTFLTPATRDVHRLLMERMKRAGMHSAVDGAGNVHGVYAGAESKRAPLLIGSHLDTVPGAGAFDGVLGVVIGIALIESLGGERLDSPVHVIGFSEEEGVRFGVPFIGSRAVIGRLDDDLLQRRDGDGISVSEALRDFALVSEVAHVDRRSSYLEFHIEQGPVLESLGVPLGIVETIVGQTRIDFRFLGKANHAGTTPMNLRRDALAAAAEWIGMVEREALATAGLAGTVGKLEAKPGTGNVIAGEVICSLDVRHAEDSVRARAQRRIADAAQAIARRRGIAVERVMILDQPAVAMDRAMTDALELAARDVQIQTHRMVSGAGHDAMILAEQVPTAMLFIRSPGGISHHPDETVLPGDVAAALAVGLRFLQRL